MSLSQYALELCALLVDETYGELSSRIFTILLRRGQLPVKDLMLHTRLTSKKLRHGLAVLAQQNLLYYNTDPETEVTYYEANKDAAYALVQSGKIMQVVENKFGVLTREVVQNLLLLGHSTVSDLCDAYEAQKKQQSRLVDLARQNELRRKEETVEDEQMNGLAKEINGANNHPPVTIATTGQLHTALFRLFDAALIERVVGTMFESPSDVQTKLEREIVQEGNGANLKTSKTKEELTKRLLGRLRKDRAAGSDWKPQKRPHNGDHRNGANGTNKRRRLSSGVAVNGDHIYEEEDDGARLDDHLVIRVNHEKFKVLLRNAQLVHLCEHKIGKTTSRIYDHLLKLMEPQIQRCQLDRHHNVLKDDPYIPPTVQAIMIASTLDKDIDPGFGVGKEPTHKERTPVVKLSPNRKRDGTEAFAGGKGDTKKKVNGAGNLNVHNSEADDGSDQDSDDPFTAPPVKPPKRQKVTFQDDALFNPPRPEDREDHLMLVRKHLDLLQSSECKFVTRHGTNDCYSVDFENIVRFMQDAELDQLVYESFGVKGHRLVRIMKQMGKMEEKSLDKLALMKPKDARTKLSEMQMSGIVEIQEVPKDATNRGNNQRIIFLWFFDNDRVKQVVLDKVYKTMSRLLQRLAVERRSARHVLELTERSDLQHIAPDTYMDQQQITELRVIEQKEATLVAQVARLDDMIGIFRDF
ncbi:DNA directed RNA polymeras-like protein III subunit Rpc82 [Amylocarpus encephaloides]|uniref:DNA-directed RNA polymerase III subunit RPC3 n=1 Tax=Amylocarpus encephaloides TaxID=45428 RepID=A0A9P7YCA7_9HELO|nr:DNA directed RNA polymeras-like protein III subunit Rpc82 [Amylocarpus encephaloides]